jgi:hypothetical protein
MAMKFLTFHDEFVTDLATNHKQDNLGPFDIIQRTKVTDAKFKLG